MPKRTDIKTILILGAGPIIIGQACEFDYAGVQACKALKAEGYRVILINSNPATIMTDPQLADATYIEPITPEVVAKIIQKEKPDALLPTMGGQTALNCALALADQGILKEYQVELIGATKEAIAKAEDRALFRLAMQKIGLEVARSKAVYTMEEALIAQQEVGFPTVIRPSYTLGGSGGGIAYHLEEFQTMCERGFELSQNHELLIEESIIGWKEFELEVVRDQHDNCVIVCSIENFDPVGVHTGDSITVAPALTLTDKEYQAMRQAAIAILREVGVETGGANVQFAIERQSGRMLVIEMNPRVSRSSALASKATGFPIAKVAAKLAVGYSLDEIRNEMTAGVIPVSFEPALDYIVVKLPRFHFEKFPQADTMLTTQMKSVGEVMAIGQNFQQALQKAIVSLETGLCGFETQIKNSNSDAESQVRAALQKPHPTRLFYIADALRLGITLTEIQQLTSIDLWFLDQIAQLVQLEQQLPFWKNIPWKLLKQRGFSDKRLAQLLQLTETEVRSQRQTAGIFPVYQRVDSCAAEFEVTTAYMYSSYLEYCEAKPELVKKVVIIGSGPNRIGQGIEFDYCCVHAAYAVKAAGYQAIMVNCNPETVSTDYDTADRLYFEPLTEEYVLAILALEQPSGVIVQLGGQTPLKLAHAIEQAGYPILGTLPDQIDLAEDRARFSYLIDELQLKQPSCVSITDLETGIKAAAHLTYPLLVRPSYVLGGQAMEVVHDLESLEHYLIKALNIAAERPVLIDQFLESAIEVDVDVLSDGTTVLIAGIMQHIEPAGIHSGDSACSLPPFSLSTALQKQLIQQATQLALALKVVGVMNVQFAIQKDVIYILEVNPRASRTMPFVAKTCGQPIINWAVEIMLGTSLTSILQRENITTSQLMSQGYAVKMPVFPFNKFLQIDPMVGPEMKSTGEAMGRASTFAEAYAKALLGAGIQLPQPGKVVLNIEMSDNDAIIDLVQRLQQLNFIPVATFHTASMLQAQGLNCGVVHKLHDARPNIMDLIKNKEVTFIIDISVKPMTVESTAIRQAALQHHIYYSSTFSAALAMVQALENESQYEYTALQ